MIAFAIVLVIVGAILLAISSPRKGGNLEIGTSDIRTNLPEITGPAKIPAFIFGLVLLGVGMWIGLILFIKSTEEEPKTVSSQPTATPIATTPTTTMVEVKPTETQQKLEPVEEAVTPTDTSVSAPTDTPTTQPTTTPAPTNTPRPTPTLTLNLVKSPLEDNFGNTAFDGSFNSDLWHQAESEKGTTCVITQKDGALFVSHTTAFKFSFCGLTTQQNANWLLTDFNEVAARLKLTTNEGDEHGSANIVLKSNNRDWFMLCHVAKYGGDEPYMNCWTPKWEEPANPGGVGGISLDTWHEFRMKIDPTTVTFEFFIDGYYYASYTPPEAADLKDDSFHLEVGILGGPKLSTSGWIDDVYIGPNR